MRLCLVFLQLWSDFRPNCSLTLRISILTLRISILHFRILTKHLKVHVTHTLLQLHSLLLLFVPTWPKTTRETTNTKLWMEYPIFLLAYTWPSWKGSPWTQIVSAPVKYIWVTFQIRDVYMQSTPVWLLEIFITLSLPTKPSNLSPVQPIRSLLRACRWIQTETTPEEMSQEHKEMSPRHSQLSFRLQFCNYHHFLLTLSSEIVQLLLRVLCFDLMKSIRRTWQRNNMYEIRSFRVLDAVMLGGVIGKLP